MPTHNCMQYEVCSQKHITCPHQNTTDHSSVQAVLVENPTAKSALCLSSVGPTNMRKKCWRAVSAPWQTVLGILLMQLNLLITVAFGGCSRAGFSATSVVIFSLTFRLTSLFFFFDFLLQTNQAAVVFKTDLVSEKLLVFVEWWNEDN